MSVFKPRNIKSIAKQAFLQWYDKDPFRQSATVAYYAVFSLPALLVIVISLAGFFFGKEAASEQIYNHISSIMGTSTAEQVQNMVEKAGNISTSIFATIVGIITLLVGATGVFAQFQTSLNIIWEVKAKPVEKQSAIVSFLKSRLFSFGLIVSIAFLLLISLLVDSALNATSNFLRENIADSIVYLFYVINFAFSIAIISTLFALMFKFVPDVKIKWRYVWSGSLIAAILFTIGKFLLGLYFGKAEPASDYGAAGSIILIMLWVSYSSMIVFFGAEFTKATSDKYSGKSQPTELAKSTPVRGKNAHI